METIKRLYRSPQFKRTALCLASVYRALLRARARDFTDGVCRRSSLVLAPHPDDETLGCGVTIMRKIEAGQPVQVVIATDGRHSHHSAKISASELAGIRQREAIDACRVLGLAADKVRFLEYEDQALLCGVAALTNQLRQIIVEIGPQEIYLPSAIDSNPDHRALNAAAMAAIDRRRPRSTSTNIRSGSGSQGLGRHGCASACHGMAAADPADPGSPTLRPIFVRSEDYLARKHAAFAADRSQATNLTGEKDWAVMDQQTLNLLIREDELFFLRLRPKARHA